MRIGRRKRGREGARAPSKQSAAPAASRHNFINWVRAVAATEVIVRHSDLVTKHFSTSTIAVPGYYEIGAIGVEVFFVLSGYVMCMRAASYRNGAHYLLARLVRLLPMYWVFTSAVIVAYKINSRWHLGGSDLSASNLLRSYLMLPAWGFPILPVGWTLEYEIVFYVLVALMAAGSRRQGTRIALFGIAAAFGLVGMVLPVESPGEIGPLSSPIGHVLSPYMLAFAIGWLVRMIDENGATWANASLTIGLLAILSLGLWQGSHEGIHLGLRVILAVGCFIPFRLAREWLQENGRLSRLMCSVGNASFSIYLSHWFVLSLLGKLFGVLSPPQVAASPLRILGIMAGVAAGLAFYLLLERPIDRILRARVLRAPSRAATEPPILAKLP